MHEERSSPRFFSRFSILGSYNPVGGIRGSSERLSVSFVALAAWAAGFALALFLAMFVGAAAAVLPWHWMVAAAVVPLFAFLAWIRPEIAILAILAMLFGVVPGVVLPSIPIGGGRLNAEDFGIPVLLVFMLLKHKGRLIQHLHAARPFLMAIGVFIGVALVSAFMALLYKTAPVKDVLNELRPYTTWLLLPLLCLAITDGKALRRFLVGVLVLAVVLAVGVTVQSFTGVKIFDKGQEVRALYTLGSANAEVMRSTTPGMFLMAGVLVYFFAAFAKGQSRRPVLLAVFSLVLVMGLVVGFGRGLWMSVMLGTVALFFFSNRGRYVTLVLMLMITGSVGLGALYVAKPGYVEAATSRFLSVGEELESGTSFGRRKEENYYAWRSVTESPLTGVGLGGRYKPDNAETVYWEAQARYVHNSYVNVLVKTGFPGLFVAVITVLVMLVRTFGNLRSPSADPAISYAAFWLVATTTVLTSMTQPNFVAANGVASICIALFLSERLRLAGANNSVDEDGSDERSR